MILALTELQGYIIVGCVTAVIPLGSAFLAYRATRKTSKVSESQGDIRLAMDGMTELIGGLRTARDEDRAEFRTALDDVNRKLETCERDRASDRRLWEAEKAELKVEMSRRLTDLEHPSDD